MPTQDKKVCCTCGKALSLNQYYKSSSLFYTDGILPICKECFKSKFNQYNLEYRSTKKAMQRMCMAFDVYFNEDIFEKSDSTSETFIGNYFRKMNIVQYKNKTFDATIEKGFEALIGDRKPVKGRVAIVDEYGNELEENSEISTKDMERWGSGLDPIDYKTLKSHYKLLKDANPNCDSNQEIFIIDLCYTKMQQMKAVRENNVDNYNKLTDSYRKTFTQAGLKTTKETAEEDFVLGVNIETIEKYTPAEYYRNQQLYKDFDKIGDYFKRYVLRPLKNLMKGTSERDHEFYVKEEENE